MSEALTPRFSVLVPTHNQRKLLVLAIRSALAQSFEDFEILVVADGCTDGTQHAVRAIGDPRIRLFDLPKAPGFGYANRNVALREARGELIAFLAHDDLFLPDHLELMSRVFDDPAAQWAYSRPVIVESDGACHPSFQNLHVPTHLLGFLERKITVPASTVVYRRVCHERFGYWDESLTNAGDRELWSRLIRGAGTGAIRFVSEPTALHFRAPWRTDLRVAGPKTRGFEAPYPDTWPLVVEPGEGSTEQAAYLAAMQADPRGWVARFRRDIVAVLDGRLAGFEFIQRRERRNRRRERRGEGGAQPGGWRAWLSPGKKKPGGAGED